MFKQVYYIQIIGKQAQPISFSTLRFLNLFNSIIIKIAIFHIFGALNKNYNKNIILFKFEILFSGQLIRPEKLFKHDDS